MATILASTATAVRRSRTVPQIPVLGYHHIHDGDDDFFRTWPESFERQMTILRQEGYRAIRPDELVALAGQRVTERHVMVTFDDAYVDFRDFAWPILKERKIPATVFVITGHIGGWNEWDRLRRAPHRHLTHEDLQRLHAEGVVIGSHTHTHRPLVQLGRSGRNTELTESRRILEALIAAPVRTLAYPGGSVDWRVRRSTEQHYDLGFGTSVNVTGAACHRWMIPRFDPCFHGNVDDFRRTLAAHSGVDRPEPRRRWRSWLSSVTSIGASNG